MLLQKKYCVSMRVLCWSQDLFVSCLKVLIGLETKGKSLVRTENSSSVNVWLGRLCIMFRLYWEVYVLMDFVENLQNENLHWFCGNRTFIDGGVYVRCSVGISSRVTSTLFRLFCIVWCQCVVG